VVIKFDHGKLDVVHTSVIPAHRRLRQEDLELKASLSYIVKLCL
jgi:hypothetical protein